MSGSRRFMGEYISKNNTEEIKNSKLNQFAHRFRVKWLVRFSATNTNVSFKHFNDSLTFPSNNSKVFLGQIRPRRNCNSRNKFLTYQKFPFGKPNHRHYEILFGWILSHKNSVSHKIQPFAMIVEWFFSFLWILAHSQDLGIDGKRTFLKRFCKILLSHSQYRVQICHRMMWLQLLS